ncbi:MAG TPA: hypothetical protein VF715_05130, partial [Thermoleophilaceae bacterium]
LAVAIGAFAASPASARDWEFAATDGTKCTLTTTHSAPYEPGGTVALSYRASARCNVAMAAIWVISSVKGADGGWWDGGYPSFCNGRIRCEANASYSHGGTATGVQPQQFTHNSYVELVLPAPASPEKFWFQMPLLEQRRDGEVGALDCLPGGRSVRCNIHESFGPG